jgi:dihydroorotase
MLALRDGLSRGAIDFIASHHQPQDWDNKTCEFEYAKNGMIGLESMFGILGAVGCSPELFVIMQTINIRKLFNLPAVEIKKGERANLTLFDPVSDYVFSEDHIHSKSKNSPMVGKKLKGQTYGIINADKLLLN